MDAVRSVIAQGPEAEIVQGEPMGIEGLIRAAQQIVQGQASAIATAGMEDKNIPTLRVLSVHQAGVDFELEPEVEMALLDSRACNASVEEGKDWDGVGDFGSSERVSCRR